MTVEDISLASKLIQDYAEAYAGWLSVNPEHHAKPPLNPICRILSTFEENEIKYKITILDLQSKQNQILKILTTGEN